MAHRRTHASFALLCTALLWPSVGKAGAPSPAGLLDLVDNEVTKGDDQYFVYDVVTKQEGSPDKSFTFEVNLKGTEWRRIRFLAPGDLKGTRILVRSSTQMYIYLPAFRKVRRVASHTKKQGFMGSAWDDAEISLSSFGKTFSPTKMEDKGKYWTLHLQRRKDVDFVHERMELDVRKDINQPSILRYYNKAGTLVKTEKRGDWRCAKGFCNPQTIQMVDHTRDDITSRMLLKKWEPNTGVQDSFFTTRALQRGT